MLELFMNFAALFIVALVGAAALTARLSVAVAELLRYGGGAWSDGGC